MLTSHSVRHYDHRGFFTTLWTHNEIPFVPVQCCLSHSDTAGTLRGVHYQEPPYAQGKLVRCLRGSVYAVVVDLVTGAWRAHELAEWNDTTLHVPEQCAFGFQTLTDDTNVLYAMSAPYCPEAARGIRWNDPLLNIPWPVPDPILSDRDRDWPGWEPEVRVL